MTEHRLYRVHRSDTDTVGIWKRGLDLLCFTMEDEKRNVKVPGETRIPAGFYRLILEHSPKFSPRPVYQHAMITLKDVPGFVGIRIHIGNTSDDSSGCILTGEYPVVGYEGRPSRIVSSTEAYRRLYNIVSKDILAGDTFIRVFDEEALIADEFSRDDTPVTVG